MKYLPVMPLFLAVALIAGCQTRRPTERYPIPVMLDPVTEEVPDVIR